MRILEEDGALSTWIPDKHVGDRTLAPHPAFDLLWSRLLWELGW